MAEEKEPVDEESAEMIANAIYSEEITEMSAEDLDKLSHLYWAEDPDVTFDELGLSEDAGPILHGTHTEEEMMTEDWDIGEDNYEEIEAGGLDEAVEFYEPPEVEYETIGRKSKPWLAVVAAVVVIAAVVIVALAREGII